ncbi:MAG TPA: SLC13 family permease [Chitinophagales bacterium]|nr:SLC13 family permease [Chitinophagales bacterium]
MTKKWLAIISAPVVALAVYLLLGLYDIPQPPRLMSVVVIWVAVWWLTEALHLGVTSLLPFVLIPLFGIMKTEEVAMQYMDQIIFLFMGGFFLAYAMEKWGLHKRLAYRIIMFTGNTPAQILMGIMLTTYVLSNWVSNTATVMMLIPAVMAIIGQKEIYNEESRKGISAAILVGLSFSATIGGMGTLVGTPPNMIFAGMYASQFPNGQPVTFLNWMAFGVPFSLTLLVVCYFILKKMFIPVHHNMAFDMSYIEQEHKKLGNIKYEEKIVLAVFLSTVVLWFFRENIDLGFVTIPGWTKLLGKAAPYIKDSTVVIFTSFFLFLIPSHNVALQPAKDGAPDDFETKETSPENLLEWKDVARLPLNIILLFGCGFAMAKGFEASGLSNVIATGLHGLHGMPVPLILLGVAILVTVLSEFASNTASIQLVLPIIIPLAASLGLNPLLLMLTATFSASLGYMLPVATAANTIVYGTGDVNARDMIRAGIILDIAGIILLLLFMLTLGNWIYGFKIFG